MFLQQSPLLRLLIPFAVGIIAGNITECNSFQAVCLFGIVSVLYLLIFILVRKISYSFRWIHGLLLTTVFFCAGFSTSILSTASNRPDHFMHASSSFYIIRITAPPIETSTAFKTEGEVKAALINGKWQYATGKIQMYLLRGMDTICYGDYIVLHGQPAPVANPLNPYEFNYASYLASHNIYAQVYAAPSKWKKLPANETSAIYDFSWKLRDYLVNVLKSAIPDKDIYSVASALLVGYEEDIGDDVLKAYSSSGTLHVLSVSGMHVALIYKVLEWLFSFLLKYKRGRPFYFITILLFIWFYSLLSGLAPSVLRAAMMLSVVILGKWMSRTSTVYNSMFVSCFLLLAFNPFLLQEVGFQLSLLAVGGIVFIHPLLFRVYTPKGKILYALWSMISISLSAQLLTFPISLYYFHQFPNLFLLSNILIIPATTIAIYACIVLVIVSKIPVLCFLAAKSVYYSIWFSNHVARITDEIPGAVIKGIFINGWEVVFNYVLVLVAVFFLLRRQSIYLCALLTGCILFSVAQCFENVMINRQSEMTVFAVKGKACTLFRNGSEGKIIIEKQDSLSDPSFAFHITNYLYSNGLSLNGEDSILNNLVKMPDEHYALFNEKRILFADSIFLSHLKSSSARMYVDYIILTGHHLIKTDKIAGHLNADLIIIDSSVRPGNATRLNKELAA
ncbi:MAG: ComEC/Rec2 family competence protein, partial [Bacteroidota bacterium]